MSRLLIIIGLAITAVGLLWPWIARLGLGRLPGDIFIQRDGFTFYAPNLLRADHDRHSLERRPFPDFVALLSMTLRSA